MSLVFVIAAMVAWVAFGSIDHSLWIQDFQRISSQKTLTQDHPVVDGDAMYQFDVVLSKSDTLQLKPGLTVYLLGRRGYTNVIHEGVLVQFAERQEPHRYRVVCQFPVVSRERDAPREVVEYHTIRIPLASLTPFEYLAQRTPTRG